ncbi:hypothetical protein PGT21_014901 [Puccinia graminis f. sp. tritici]|uniref:Uncharacterized protein n=1 Tax=Puccinia graminis f. sp. tritici TaxID=56615 RepID=A0A5B0QEX6_PUCGR|nr:hypothetical protein PGT21_020707 [Puccinia graminis f. sp. tritici]KAA1111786.1 hypothetical protein PGT21_012339 [Puccinia graminis f. sp. tritici]KAA1112900.1 hypothetical protein PGT21_014901 [Puccinia graminis f. sp. tritici]
MDLSRQVCNSVHNFHGVITQMMLASTLGAATVDFDPPMLRSVEIYSLIIPVPEDRRAVGASRSDKS